MASDGAAAPRFFVLTKGSLWSRYDTEVDPVEPINRADAPRCPRCGGFVGLLKWLPPYRVQLKIHGEELGDLLKKSAYEFLVSERFAQAFRAEALTGLEGFHPVEVIRVRHAKKRSREPLAIPNYRVVSTIWGRGAVDPVLNRVRITAAPACPECLATGINAIHGFVLEPDTWNGEDIFRPRGLVGEVIVSERFKNFVERHGFTSMVLTPTEDYVWDPSGLGPAPRPPT